MKKQVNSKKHFAKSAFALAALIVGGLGVYAEVSGDAALPAQASSTQAGNANAPSVSSWGANPLVSAPPAQVAAQPLTVSAHQLSQNGAPEASDLAALAPASVSQEMLAKMEISADFIPGNAEGGAEAAPFARINLKEFSSGAQAIALLADDLPAVAKWYGMTSEGMRNLLLSDSSVHLDHKGRILHIDAGLATPGLAGSTRQASGTTSTATTTTASPFPLDQTFKLHTKPASTRVLYMNFTGDSKNPAFSLDSVPSTFNEAEQILIQKVWQRVVEDYAPFDIDITTEKPTVTAGKIGAVILISPQTSTAGGYAYLNSFMSLGIGVPPAFCFPNKLANSEKPIAECISHEVGHTLGLNHQGVTPSTEYYAGQGSGETAWAPIMGVGYYKNLTQWAKGEYTNANNKLDAFAIMSKQGLKPAADQHGNSIAMAGVMQSVVANGYNNLSASGVIEITGDVDMFSFVAGAGNLSFSVNGAALGGNLDISLQLLDSNGKLLASANAAETLASSINFILPAAGKYFLSVSGAGKGAPLVTGYSNYASLGQYSIKGTSAISTDVPPAIAVTVSFQAPTKTSTGALIQSYLWNFGDGSANATTRFVTHTYTKAGTYTVTLTMVDSWGFKSVLTKQVVIK